LLEKSKTKNERFEIGTNFNSQPNVYCLDITYIPILKTWWDIHPRVKRAWGINQDAENDDNDSLSVCSKAGVEGDDKPTLTPFWLQVFLKLS